MSIETNAIAAVSATQAGQAQAGGAGITATSGHVAQGNPAAYAAQGPGQVEQGMGAPNTQAAPAADAQQFGGMMRAAPVTTVQPATLPVQPIPVVAATGTPSPVPDVSFTFTRGPVGDGMMGQWRDYGHDLNERYTSINAKRQEMLDSLDSMDVTMTMVKLADFSYFASMTLAEYQMDMSFAQAANGVSHSLLKNQEG